MKTKILITSGGTSEYIDDVRILTNISTGKLGAEIAFQFRSNNFPVTYLHGKNAKEVFRPFSQYRIDNKPSPFFEAICTPSTNDLFKKMEELVPHHDVIIHAMAVSDFGFKRDKSIKLKSNDKDAFIDYLRDNIVVNPKILSYVKKWNSKAILVGFKFEVGKTTDELINIAYESLLKNDCDYVVANDKAEMEREKEHIAYLIDKNKNYIKCFGKTNIAQELFHKIIQNAK